MSSVDVKERLRVDAATQAAQRIFVVAGLPPEDADIDGALGRHYADAGRQPLQHGRSR